MPKIDETILMEPKEEGITVKFSGKEKEEIRAFANATGTGMSTLLYDAYHFYKKFYSVHREMRRFSEMFIAIAESITKYF